MLNPLVTDRETDTHTHPPTLKQFCCLTAFRSAGLFPPLVLCLSTSVSGRSAAKNTKTDHNRLGLVVSRWFSCLGLRESLFLSICRSVFTVCLLKECPVFSYVFVYTLWNTSHLARGSTFKPLVSS